MQLKSRAAARRRQKLSTVNSPQLRDNYTALKPMLKRLEVALGQPDLAQKILLLSRPKKPSLTVYPDVQTTNFVVGYSGSAHSQAALDLALCMAHQTRLATPNPVVVHVVYVVDKNRPRTIANADRILWQARCLASEWRGSLNAHLRIGQVAAELSAVAKELEAEVLMLGCHVARHPLVRQLASQTPCSVLGLPQ